MTLDQQEISRFLRMVSESLNKVYQFDRHLYRE